MNDRVKKGFEYFRGQKVPYLQEWLDLVEPILFPPIPVPSKTISEVQAKIEAFKTGGGTIKVEQMDTEAVKSIFQ